MLTDRQKLFVFEYVKDFKPMAAAERAGYTAPPWSDEVRAAVDEEIRNKRELLSIDAALVLREIATVAFASMGDYYEESWALKDISTLTDIQKHAIEAVQIEEREIYNKDGDHIGTNRTVKLKLHSKNAALEMLGKNYKLFTERVEHDLTDGLAERLAEARARILEPEAPKMLAEGIQ